MSPPDTLHTIKESALVYILDEVRAAFRFNLRGDPYETQKAMKNAIAELCSFGDLDPKAVFKEDEDYVYHERYGQEDEDQDSDD